MRLQDFLGTNHKYGFEAIALDEDLANQIQTQLIGLRLLDPPADGKFGPLSAAALRRFQNILQIGESEYLGKITAEKLIETKSSQLPKPPLKLSNNLPSRIIKYMLAKDYVVFTEPKEYNIVYIEGMNEDGTLNNDAPNEFNDRRIVIEIVDGIPKIVNHWQATTEPGTHYTIMPMNPQGAARIQFGQYKAWAVGMHGNADRHEALVQVAPITVCRDFNQDYKRTGDKLDTGLFMVNQHWGYDAPANDIKNASAGCLVGRRREGHREFMAIIKQDRRYVANPGYVFYTTIIGGDNLVKMFPA
ncbi:MAG: peptidoglycan-binding protein [Heteroscytonema crispum UTEX LB 1556]